MKQHFGGRNIGTSEPRGAETATYSEVIADSEIGESEVLVAKGKRHGGSSEGVRCFNCNKRGHFARNCRSKVKKGLRSSSSSPQADKDFAALSCVAESQSNICSIAESFLLSVYDACKRLDCRTSKEARPRSGKKGAADSDPLCVTSDPLFDRR